MIVISSVNAQEIVKVFGGKLSILVQAIIDTKHAKEFEEEFSDYRLDLDKNASTELFYFHVINWLASKGYYKTLELARCIRNPLELGLK